MMMYLFLIYECLSCFILFYFEFEMVLILPQFSI